MEIQKTIGLIAPPPTPMHEDGRLNLDMVKPLAKYLHSRRLFGVFVAGTTGESMSLTVEERLSLAQCWVQAAPEGLKVIVHVGHACLQDAERMAAHAQSIGADAIAAMPPIFFKPKDIPTLVASSARIAATAPKLPFYYYHIPSMTGIFLPMAEFLTAAKEQIPNLAGMKFTHSDLPDFRACLDVDGGRFDLLFGQDEMLLGAMATGARGAVGTTYNFLAPLYLAMMEAFAHNNLDTARQLQSKAIVFLNALFDGSYDFMASVKAVMKMLGLDCGQPRMPLCSITPEQYEALQKKLQELGFFDYTQS
ncbi:MAG: dihydrodipicolinate synthase family protein [Sedimentisphaerales bacterium]|nr:dihydrodipicolinate synthase family protein [Sedimentisphaerales bacterium]